MCACVRECVIIVNFVFFLNHISCKTVACLAHGLPIQNTRESMRRSGLGERIFIIAYSIEGKRDRERECVSE